MPLKNQESFPGRKIPIKTPKEETSKEHYQLHLDADSSVQEDPIQKDSIQEDSSIKEITKEIPAKKNILSFPLKKTGSTQNQKQEKKKYRLWNFLEWIATSALIFTVFFVIINYSSYAGVLEIKINKWLGTFQTNPYIDKISKTEQKPVAQELLPLEEEKQKRTLQVPNLDLEIAPPDERIIIRSINKNIPVVQISTENLIKRDWGALENDIQDALRDGVVHFPGTANPGDEGNVVITGHSSYFPWDPGRFKDVFADLHYVHEGDTVIVYHNQKKYEYVIYEITKVNPDQIEVLTQEGENRLTLITCTPIGTNWRRLIVKARPVAVT